MLVNVPEAFLVLYLFCYEPEALVWSVTLVRLPQDRVKRFTPRSEEARRVGRHCKRCHINLHRRQKANETLSVYVSECVCVLLLTMRW